MIITSFLRIVQRHGNDGNARFSRDVIEAELPFLHLAAGSFGRDGERYALAPRKFRNAGTHDVPALGAVDGHAAEPARQDAERPEKDRVLGEPGVVEPQNEERAKAVEEVPVGRVRRHDQHVLRNVGDVAGDAPARDPHEQDAEIAPPARRTLRRQRRKGRKTRILKLRIGKTRRRRGRVGLAMSCRAMVADMATRALRRNPQLSSVRAVERRTPFPARGGMGEPVSAPRRVRECGR